jgi:hypothetical protein
LARTQEKIDKQRKQLEDSIAKMQVAASRDSSGKGSGQVASRKKKLNRIGAEKNEHGHRFRAQQDSTNGMSSIRAGSVNGKYFTLFLALYTACRNEFLIVLFLLLPFSTETAMGRKTGESRCLLEAAEREWKMTLPAPTPLGILEGVSCLQLRSATVGFLPASAAAPGPSSSSSSTGIGNSSGNSSGSSNSTEPLRTKVSSSLGSKKIKVVDASSAAAAAASAAQEGATVIVENVTLDAHQKSKIAILGKNGCGKRYD